MAEQQPRSCLLASLTCDLSPSPNSSNNCASSKETSRLSFLMKMSECRGGGDCLIKLFGKTIPVDAKDLLHSGGGSSSIESDDAKENTHQDTPDPPPQPEVVDAEDPKSSPPESSRQRPGDDDDEANNLKEKLRKPDKVLPCPRCNSMDTKFCYFNNYNVNQPRHFCKNCQRYWTAGGAMRNVPVGAGRRKNKNAVAAAASHFLHRVRAAAGDPPETNGTVLSFGHGGAPALLDLAEQEVSHLKEKLLNLQSAVGPCSDGSSNRDGEKNHLMSGTKDSVPVVAKPANGAQHPANMNGATMWPYSCAPSQQAYYPPGIAIPMIYPAAPGYWGCMVPGGWNLPWPAVQSPAQGGLSSPSSVSSGADSLTLLGKHAREGDEGIRSHGSGKVWAPKTIRIDDADEVAKSSIWSLIGIKGDKQNADMDGRKHGASTVFEPKHDEAKKTAKQAMITTGSPLLHANPVALTRSLTFQEGS